jgi:hypothetical protein
MAVFPPLCATLIGQIVFLVEVFASLAFRFEAKFATASTTGLM